MSSPDREEMPYRQNAGIVLFNPGGLVLIGNRARNPNEANDIQAHTWQMPQGGIDDGEDPFDAAKRELFEETNVRSAELIAAAPDWVSYDLPDAALGTALKGKYRGQKQMWFAMKFTGDEGEIDVLNPGDGVHRPEFDSWRWAELAALPDLIVPFKRAAYQQLATWFAGVPENIRNGPNT